MSRDKIGPKTVIKIGDTWDTVAAWQSAGVIGPDLKMVEQKTEEAPAPAKLDFEMSSEGENVLRASFEKLGQPFMYSVYDNVIEKGTLTEARVSEIASRMGIEPAQANEMITTRVNEYVGHAMKLTGLEGHDFWSASDHLWSTRTDEMREAVNAFALEHRAGPLKKLFDGYKASAAAYNEDALENATFGDGVDVYRDSSTRKLMVNARGDVLPLADAIKHGIVAVSRKK